MTATRQLLSTSTLRELAAWPPGPCMSVFVPVDRSIPQPAGMEKAIKPLLRTARVAVSDARLADTLVGELEALIAEPLDPAAHGLALFATSGRTTRIDLGPGIEPAAFGADAPVLVPLVPLVEPDAELFILALGRHEVALYSCDRSRIDVVHVEGLPRSIEDELWYEKHEPSMNRHGGPREAGVAGVVGGGTSERDLRKDAFERFAQHVAKALRPVLSAHRRPLVVVALPHDAAAFRAACDHEPMLVVGEAAGMSPARLHEVAWEAATPLTTAPIEAALERLGTLSGTGLTEYEPDAVAAAAGEGRVETLLIASDAADLTALAEAVIGTYRTGGAVLPVTSDRLLGRSLGAVLRY